jgi:hypothetical protein
MTEAASTPKCLLDQLLRPLLRGRERDLLPGQTRDGAGKLYRKIAPSNRGDHLFVRACQERCAFIRTVCWLRFQEESSDALMLCHVRHLGSFRLTG